jgi:hypothetical protein
MAREQTDTKDRYWRNWHTTAEHTTNVVHVYTWTCHNCKTVNTTRIVAGNPGHKARCFRGVKARCGKCHGNTTRLCDKTGLTWDPFDA